MKHVLVLHFHVYFILNLHKSYTQKAQKNEKKRHLRQRV